jgi:hypothetical protein
MVGLGGAVYCAPVASHSSPAVVQSASELQLLSPSAHLPG